MVSRLFTYAITVLALGNFLACGHDTRGSSQCASKLSYATNRFTSGEHAIKHAAEYFATISLGENDYNVSAIVDTASAGLVVNEKDFSFGDETITTQKPFVVQHGSRSYSALKTKDMVDIGCSADVATNFAITAKDSSLPNLLGLAYSDYHPQKNPAFFDQLVKDKQFKNEFSLALCGLLGNSRIVLGGIDEVMRNLIGNFIPIIEKTVYVVPALELKRADTKASLGEFPTYNAKDKTGTRTILDSATAFLMLPSDMATRLSHEISDEARALGLLSGFPEGFFRIERASSIKVVRFKNFAQMRQFPALEISFTGIDGKTKSLEISPLHYFKEIDANDPLVRTFAIREAKADVILGQPFLESHYLYFDRKNSRIGVGNIDVACAL